MTMKTTKTTTRQRQRPFAVLLCLSAAAVSTTTGFLYPQAQAQIQRSPTTSLSSSNIRYHNSNQEEEQEEMDQMKQEIEKLRAEAQQRLQALNDKLQHEGDLNLPQTTVLGVQAPPPQPQVVAVSSTSTSTTPHPPTTRPRDDLFQEAAMEFQESSDLFEARIESDRMYLNKENGVNHNNNNNHNGNTIMDTTAPPKTKKILKVMPPSPTLPATATAAAVNTDGDDGLLENTRWRLMLNVGREPGTWMPKTWGISGERLLMNLELEFGTNDANIILGGDEFLNGNDHGGDNHHAMMIHSYKPLHVIHNTATLAPNLQEGGRQGLRVKDGAWRVAPGEGPMGTSVLRFYLELEEQVQHSGSDVYCPAGRIYCTCGYFPMAERLERVKNGGTSMKDLLRKEQVSLNAEYNALLKAEEENDDISSILNVVDKLKRAKQMMDLRVAANKLTQKMNAAQVHEPDKSLLRLSQDQMVGLTREGGVCCKVNKGLAIEYHILGKFEIASMTNRDHGDYRDSLSSLLSSSSSSSSLSSSSLNKKNNNKNNNNLLP